MSAEDRQSDDPVAATEGGVASMVVLTLNLFGWTLAVFAAFSLLIVALNVFVENEPVDPAGLTVAGIVGGLAAAALVGARRLKTRGRLSFATLGLAVFGGAGALMMVGGIAMLVAGNADGWILSLFGLPFAGAGYLAHRVFAPAPGKRFVDVASFDVDARTGNGRPSRLSGATLIEVDSNASDADIAAARADWQRRQLDSEPDWQAGEIIEEGVRTGWWQHGGAIVTFLSAAAIVPIAVYLEPLMWVAAIGALGMSGMLGFHSARLIMRRRRFGISRLTLEPVPVAIGGTFAGEIDTGVAQRDAPADGFTLALSCVNEYETRTGSGDSARNVVQSDTLWQTRKVQADRRASRTRIGRISVPVTFTLPTDQPPGALERDGRGIHWELSISATLPGLDYAARFRLPVVAADADA